MKWGLIVAALLLVTALRAGETDIPADLEAFIETRDPGDVRAGYSVCGLGLPDPERAH